MDLITNVILEVVSSSRFALVTLALVVVLPVIFYIASFDKRPVKIRYVKKTKGISEKRADSPDESREEEKKPEESEKTEEKEGIAE